MFGKLMNGYFYGKSGKGDFNKDDLPKNRWQLFFEMLRIRLSALIRLNLMYMIVWLPAMIVILLGVMSALTGMSDVIAAEGDMSALLQQLRSMLVTTLLLLIPCIAITGPCTAGVCYVTRNWARDEHAFIWSDFKDAVKENWKQSIVISIITGVLPYIVYVCWSFYGSMADSTPIMLVPQILTAMIGLVWTMAVGYFYPLIVSYKLKLRDVLRNGLLLSIARLPMSIGMRLLHLVPALIAFAVVYFTGSVWGVLGLFLYYVVIGFGLSRFVTASVTNAVFDRFINSKIEGAQVDRGLAQPDDDEDDDEDETNE